MPQRFHLRVARPRLSRAAAILSSLLTLAVANIAAAEEFDFSEALQSLRNGETVESVHVGGATLRVDVEHHSSHVAVVFDTEHPKKYPELGTPNEEFDGPGEGHGGEPGRDGENESELGKVLVIAEDDVDLDDECPSPELDDGRICLSFSHAGYLTFKLINVDDDDTHLVAYRDGQIVGELEADDLGENSVQDIDLSGFGTVDRVVIDLEGVTAVAAIRLDVPVTAVQARTWTEVKRSYR
jgi:hypothetical protein